MRAAHLQPNCESVSKKQVLDDKLLPHQILFLLARVIILNGSQVSNHSRPDFRFLSAGWAVKMLASDIAVLLADGERRCNGDIRHLILGKHALDERFCRLDILD